MHISGTGIEASVLITSSLNLFPLAAWRSERTQYQFEVIHRLQSIKAKGATVALLICKVCANL